MSREIMRAIFDGDIERFDLLVKEGFDVNTVTETDKWNLLHRALVSIAVPPTPAMIRHLIDLGINVNTADEYGNTPLHYAARLKNPELMELLLDAGAKIDPVNKDGLTPLRLMLMTRPPRLDAIELLLSRGADINQRIDGMPTVKEYAETISHGDDLSIIELFQKYSVPDHGN